MMIFKGRIKEIYGPLSWFDNDDNEHQMWQLIASDDDNSQSVCVPIWKERQRDFLREHIGDIVRLYLNVEVCAINDRYTNNIKCNGIRFRGKFI